MKIIQNFWKIRKISEISFRFLTRKFRDWINFWPNQFWFISRPEFPVQIRWPGHFLAFFGRKSDQSRTQVGPEIKKMDQKWNLRPENVPFAVILLQPSVRLAITRIPFNKKIKILVRNGLENFRIFLKIFKIEHFENFELLPFELQIFSNIFGIFRCNSAIQILEILEKKMNFEHSENFKNFVNDDHFQWHLYINTFDIKQLKLTSSIPIWPFSVIINCTWRGIISKQKFSKISKSFLNSQNWCSRFLNKGQHRFIIHLNFDQIQVEQKIYLARQNMTKKYLVRNDRSIWSKVTDRSFGQKWPISDFGKTASWLIIEEAKNDLDHFYFR